MPASSRSPVAAPLAALVAVLAVLPVVVVVAQAVVGGAAEAVDYLWRPRIGELLAHTGWLLLITVPCAVALGVGAAWLVERTDLPFAGVWRTLMLAPLAVPAFVSSYAWISWQPGLVGLRGAALVTTLAYFPFVFLPVAALLRVLDASEEDIARSLGLSPFQAFLRSVLPRLRPAISGGALLVALHLLAEYGVLEMMRYQTFTTAILQQYAVGFSDVRGSLLASVLLVLCLVVLTLEVVARGRRRVARLGSGTVQRAVPQQLGRWKVPVLAGLLLVVGLALVVPVVMVLRWLLVGTSQSGAAATDLFAVTATTLSLAVAGGLLAVVLGLPGALLLSRGHRLGAMVLERVTFVASALPGVVIALALVTLAVRWAPALYQTSILLLVAYAILFLPRAMVSLRSGLTAAPPELSDAARSLGAGGTGVLTRVVLPLAAPSVLAGFVLVALAISTELTATLLLAPTGVDTLALAFWASADELDYAAAAPYAAMMIALSIPLTVVLRRQIVSDRG
ncbi:MAG: ABC transporter permease subunit [Ornithinimicrobium sp.]|uniref:ABC transporter permease n=1 Tax=Ornithinimicrobium sp. TaxID=1977084 RepID=UPI0026E05E9F|nr:ABC transporter permease subunit [Ornithinimicrobium sp.]MDO5739030.1 ABC transporter permease subunit [Ornithinimicrobium sp.]